MNRREWTAHPRSRGENSTGEYFGATSMGSSPLTRGKRDGGRGGERRCGLIPAHAGKTIAGRGRSCRPQAHPRSRGENTNPWTGEQARAGSSPLTRGKRRLRRGRAQRHGLIPAHAGKTFRRQPRSQSTAAHPRSRGENRTRSRIRRRRWGSSPLTRGKQELRRWIRRYGGLIPAHAGKTLPRRALRARCRAHPRSRGENISGLFIDAAAKGSSPLTRGKQASARHSNGAGGLIPAHAGKTMATSFAHVESEAHPRSRGENSAPASAMLTAAGSSPLTRGKRGGGHWCVGAGGLIPAHAGKTAFSSALHRGAPAHPRSRGENLFDLVE